MSESEEEAVDVTSGSRRRRRVDDGDGDDQDQIVETVDTRDEETIRKALEVRHDAYLINYPSLWYTSGLQRT